jgi:DNA polymerase III epsilon subunit-like protein
MESKRPLAHATSGMGEGRGEGRKALACCVLNKGRRNMERWIALDVETTGLSPTRHEIRELAAVPFGICDRPEQVRYFTSVDFHPSARRAAAARWADLVEMIGERCVLVAHNAAFDIAFLAEALRRAGVRSFMLRAYCTLRLARRVLPDLPRYDLTSLREQLDLQNGQPHVAVADARAVAALFTALVARAGVTNEDDIRALHGPAVQVRCRSAARSNADG